MSLIFRRGAGDIPAVRTLFREYADSLNVDLGFQRFDGELASLPGPYDWPDGEIYLAYWNGLLAGCAAIKPLFDDVCELKRLYVRQAYRGCGIGRTLCEAMIREAENRGYRWMRLDTLARLSRAARLYQEMGFIEIEAYYDNPLPERVVFMERALVPPYADGDERGISTGSNPPRRPLSR